ncbi:protein boule-like isoform X1 [Anguilla rostrata]|uniref:protein boule-like isoform X1 n=1 Tax=Anguilla rostrata TaxID=7938 RepID=UPI0030D43304
MENETNFACNQTQTSTPSPAPVSPCSSVPPHHAPRYGTIIPNRIFVGGIDFKTNESDLRRFFSQHGAVKEVKIVIDRAGVSKGYGFVTFETQEDAQKIIHDVSADRLCFRDKRLNIGQAIRKQQLGVPSSGFSISSPSPGIAIPASAGTMYLTTSTGYPYTYHNGVAYFHPPEMSPPAQHWPPRSMSGSPVMVAHQAPPVYPQPTYHHYQAPAQCVPGPLQWNMSQSPVPSSPLLYLQPSELLYQPLDLPADGGCVPPPMPLLEASVPEPYIDHMVQPAYHQLYAQSPGGMAPIMQQEIGKEQRFHCVRRGFPHSQVGLKARYSRSPHCTHPRKEYRPDVGSLSPPPPAEPLK